MVPNVSTLDADGCLWICLNPGCPEPAAGELEAEDLAGAGVSTSAGTGSDVEDEALAGRLARAGAGALAAHLSDALVVSYHSDDFDEAQEARQALAVVAALCAVLRRAAGGAQDRLAGIEAEVPGLLATGEV